MITENTLRHAPVDLEELMIPVEQWGEAPEEAQRIAKESSNEGISTGIGKCEELGWYVLCSAGQGPGVVWSEKSKEK